MEFLQKYEMYSTVNGAVYKPKLLWILMYLDTVRAAQLEDRQALS